MSISEHQSYSNPTIQEAICEIVFAMPENQTWNPIWFGEFFKLVQNEFTSFEPVNMSGIQLQIGSGNPGAPPPPSPSQIVRYRHPSRPSLLQLSDQSLAVSCLPVYPGWDVMLKDIEYGIEKLKAVVKPEKALRIGLRYINRIERSVPDETLKTWFMPNDYMPKIILESLPGFISLVQTRLDENNRLNVTVGEQIVNLSQPAFILDIDRILERDLAIESEVLLPEMTRLHEDVWKVFNSAKTEKLERMLNGELL